MFYVRSTFFMTSDSSCFQVRRVPVGDLVLLESTIEVVSRSEVVSVRLSLFLCLICYLPCMYLLKDTMEQLSSFVYWPAYIAGVIPRSLQLQVLILASLGSFHKSGQCAKSCASTSVCFCRQSGGGANIGLLT